MRFRFCSLFRRPRKSEPSPSRGQEPEWLNDWHREAELERRRAATIHICNSIAAREAAERRAASFWWRRQYTSAQEPICTILEANPVSQYPLAISYLML